MVYLNTKTKYALLIFIISIIIVIILINPSFDNTYATRGKILAKNTFIIRTNTSGGVETFSIDNASGQVEKYSIYSFQRGDVVDYRLINKSGSIFEGDTLAVFASNRFFETENEIALTISELEGTLTILTTGEKEEILNEMRSRVSFAEKQLETQNKLYERSKLLLEKNIISQQEFDIVEGQLELYKIDLSIKKQMLADAETGSKPEAVFALRQQIEAARNLGEALKNRIERLKVIAPFTGKIQTYENNDTLLIVNSISNTVVKFAIPAAKLNQINIGDEILIQTLSDPILTEIESIDENTFFYAGEPYLKVTSKPFIFSDKLALNSVVNCNLSIGSITLIDYIIENVN